MDGARSYSMMDSTTFVYSSTGNENVDPWPLGDVVVVKTINDTLKWSRISLDKGHYDNCSSGDINNDGLIDVVTMHMGTNSMRNGNHDYWWGIDGMIPYTQNPDGSFSENQNIISDPNQWGDNTWPGNHSAGAVLVANVMNDNKPEIILADYGFNPSSPSIRYNFAIFGFNEIIKKYQYIKSPKDLGIFSNYSQGATSMKAADFNKDGQLDIAIATEGSLENGKPGGVVQIWLNKENGDFTPDQKIICDPDSVSIREFEIGDVNKDGWDDIILNGGSGFAVVGGGMGAGAYVNLGPLIWLNNKGQLEPFSEQLQVNKFSLPQFIGGPIMNPVKAFYIDGKFSFMGFQRGCNLERCNVDTTNNFNLYEFSVIFCDKEKKPLFNTTQNSFCTGDSLKLTITNVNKGDSLKWYYGNKSDISNVVNKIFNDSLKIYVTRTDSIGCIYSSDTIQLKKYAIPGSPSLVRDTANNIVASINGITWYKDGVKIADTTQKIKPTTNGIYTATTTQNGCTSILSQGYNYLTNAIANLPNGEYFKISPNPTSGELNINFRISSTKDVYISVMDINGRAVLLNKIIESESKVNLGSISKGNYIIQVKDKTGKLLFSQKIIKD